MTPLEIIRQKKNSAPQAESCLPPADRIAVAEAETLDASPSTCESACPVCGSPLFWLAKLPATNLVDPSKPRLHCAGCKPPPSPIFVSAWLLVVWEGGQWRFEDYLPRFNLARRR